MNGLDKLPIHRLRWMLKHAKREAAEADKARRLASGDYSLDPRFLNDWLDAQRWVDELEDAIENHPDRI